jgi:hypothetical protein
MKGNIGFRHLVKTEASILCIACAIDYILWEVKEKRLVDIISLYPKHTLHIL